PATITPLVLGAGDWPGFRGPNRDSRLAGVSIATDWSSNPPPPIWKHRVGAGWSSFAVVGKHLFTQEQWRDEEAIVCYDADDGKSVLAYKAKNGELAWSAGEGTHSYCSMHPARLAGVEQLLVSTEKGLMSFEPKTGKVLWKYDWSEGDFQRVVQPTIVSDTDVLLGTGFGKVKRRLHVSKDAGAWKVDEIWT